MAEQVDDLLQITVVDNGPGISEEDRKKVFERFYKADVNNHEGTGIGLSLVKEYAQSLDGDVSIESSPGQGTTFTVHIPLQLAAGDQDEKLEPVELGRNGKPVMLVVEDHADLNDFICRFFENDFDCVAAFDGEEALEKIQTQMPEIVISDLMMPRMDGSTFVQEIKSSDRFGHIPVIVLSAKSQTESRIDLYQLGADNYLVKPFEIQELSAVVMNVLDQRRKLKETFRENYLTLGDREVPVDGSQTKVAVNPLLEKAMAYVLEHLDDSALSVKTMAEDLGMGRNRFQKEIKDLTHLTPVEFVRSIRLNEAHKMLRESNANVSEVAYAVGFNNLSYFTRSFKSEFGRLPSDISSQLGH